MRCSDSALFDRPWRRVKRALCSSQRWWFQLQRRGRCAQSGRLWHLSISWPKGGHFGAHPHRPWLRSNTACHEFARWRWMDGLHRADDFSCQRAASSGFAVCKPLCSTSRRQADTEALQLDGRGCEPWRPCRPKWCVCGGDEVEFELLQGPDCVPKSVLEVLSEYGQGSCYNFPFSLGPAVNCNVIPAFY